MMYRCRNEDGWAMEQIRGEVEKLTGYSRSTLENKKRIYRSRVIRPDDRAAVSTAVQDALAMREPFEVAYRIRTKDDESKWVRERGRGIYADDGSVEALEGFITEITDRKR